MNPSLEVTLDSFHGPFDLLLQLIKDMEIDIMDIPIAQITDQYLTYIQAMDDLDLDRVGDYLVMAATLLEIKSRMLLPIEPGQAPNDLEEDPRGDLVQQLLLYQQFQSLAEDLGRLEDQRGRSFSRPEANLSRYHDFIPLKEGEFSLQDLTQALLLALDRYENRQPLDKAISRDTVSVSDRMAYMEACLKDQPGTAYRLEDFYQGVSRPEIVATFMAMLELVRKQVIVFRQEGREGPIFITALEEANQ